MTGLQLTYCGALNFLTKVLGGLSGGPGII